MSEREKTKDTAGAPRRRKPYVKPAVAWQEELEVRKTLAVACAKLSAGPTPTCRAAATS